MWLNLTVYIKTTASVRVGISVNLSCLCPPGVKDGISVALQRLTLSGPLTGASTPAVHHAQPVRWVRRRIPIEPDQFADADK